MTKQVRRPNVAKGVLVPLGNGFSLAIGKHPEKTDDIDIGPNNKNGLSVNHGEILQNTGNNIRVFSAEPILGGQSPAQLLYGGANPNAVFAAQEAYKKAHKLRDDGTHYWPGGKKKKVNNIVKILPKKVSEITKLPDNWEKIIRTNPEVADYLFQVTSNGGFDYADTPYIRYTNRIKELKNGPEIIPYDEDKEIMLTTNGAKARYRTGKISTSVLDYLYDNAAKANVPFRDIVGLAGKESTLGIGRGYKKGQGISPVNLLSYWNGIGYNNVSFKELEKAREPYTRFFNGEPVTLDEIKATEEKYNKWYNVLHNYDGDNIVKSAYDFYKAGKYNPGEKGYDADVRVQGDAILSDKKVQEWLKTKEPYNGRGFNYGGQITKQSLGERPNAKLGKEMKNNKRQHNYLGSGNLRTLADINAAKEKLGNYYSTFYNPDGTVKKAMPTFGQLQGTTFTPAEQKMYKKIWGEDFYNKNVSGSGQFVGAFGDKLSAPTTNLAGTDQYGNTIDANGQITKLAVPKTKLAPRNTVGSAGNAGRGGKGSFFNSQAGADLIGAGINAIGSITSAIINNKYANKLKFTPREAVHYDPVKLKTKINIAPQIAQMKEMRARLQDAAVKTSGSSRTAYQKILAGHNSLLESAMNLYGQKENQETQLINQDRLNQQSVAHKNAKEFIDTVNYNAAGRDNLENTRAQLKAQNAVSTINNLAGIVNGPQGLLARKEARNSQLANLAVMSAAYPDAIKLMQGDGWEKRLNGLRNLVNNGYWG